MGISAALLILGKLLLAHPNERSEARALLQSRVNRGPETIVHVTDESDQHPGEYERFTEAK